MTPIPAMKRSLQKFWSAFIVVLVAHALLAQEGQLRVAKKLQAGSAFSIPTEGSGKGVLYIVGVSQVIRRDVNLGESVNFAAGELHEAGRYVAVLSESGSSARAQFDVVAVPKAANLSFLAKPSRLPVSQRDGISGVAYVFDVYRNLILQPLPVAFEFSGSAGATQKQTVTTRDGVAWVRMSSPSKAGVTQFQASVGGITEKRVVQQFAGDPCSLRMSAQPSGSKVVLQTEPVRDCNGNPVPDGTVVTFTESYKGSESTVDVPIKRDTARTEMPTRDGAVISVASGVVLGNEIRLGSGGK